MPVLPKRPGEVRGKRTEDIVFLRGKEACEARCIQSACALLLPQHAHHDRPEETHEAFRAAVTDTGVLADCAGEGRRGRATKKGRQGAGTGINKSFLPRATDCAGQARQSSGLLMSDSRAQCRRAFGRGDERADRGQLARRPPAPYPPVPCRARDWRPVASRYWSSEFE